MSIIGSNILAGASGQAAGGYEIEQSLRFNSADSTYLYRIPGSAGNRRTWTLSFWFKRGKVGTDQQIFSVSDNYGSPSLANYFYIIISGADNKMYVQQVYPTYNTALDFSPNGRVFRDPSAWYHVVLAIDTTQATGSNRQKMWINGELQTLVNGTSGGPTTISQNYETTVNTTNQHRFGLHSSAYFDGYLAEVNLVDGSALTHEDFGELDNNGVWRPIEYAGSYTGNSFYLKFDAADVDGDSSGLGNDFTAVNVTTSGTGTDVMDDTPTTNWCTLNPLKKDTNTTLSNGNLRAAGSSSTAYTTNTQATFTQSSGKWYYEADYVSSSSTLEAIGWARASIGANYNPTSNSGLVYRAKQGDYFDLSGQDYYNAPTVSPGAVIQIAIDFDAGKIWFGSGGTWFKSGDPAAGSNALMTFTGGAEELSPCVRTLAATFEFNFGQRAFAYTPPTNFLPLNTANLPAPDIADGSEYFNTILWAGNNDNPRTLTGVGFQPDWVWLKDRTQSTNHRLVDVVRGAGNTLKSNNTSSETSSETAGTITAFTSDGFTVEGTSNVEGVNLSGDSYVAWNWLAGGSGSSNTDGSITSTVSANPTAGFSIVNFTGTGANATVGHGLGVATDLLILKNRDNGLQDWPVYHSALGATKQLVLSSDAAASTNSVYWNNTEPTSTVFTVGTAGNTNGSGEETIAYCFAEVEGYSKFGSYTGNGSTDGPFVYCGFRPAYVWLRGSTFASNWNTYDSARSEYNVADDILRLNSAAAEVSNYSPANIDLLSNGFKIRTSSGDWNSSGQTFVFCAFAEHPTGGSGVSPATAR